MSLQDRVYTRRISDVDRERRAARLRKAMLRLEPWAKGERERQLVLFPTRWERFKLATVRLIRTEWFSMALFLALVLVAVIWSARASL